jgi:hypothetical protein
MSHENVFEVPNRLFWEFVGSYAPIHICGAPRKGFELVERIVDIESHAWVVMHAYARFGFEISMPAVLCVCGSLDEALDSVRILEDYDLNWKSCDKYPNLARTGNEYEIWHVTDDSAFFDDARWVEVYPVGTQMVVYAGPVSDCDAIRNSMIAELEFLTLMPIEDWSRDHVADLDKLYLHLRTWDSDSRYEWYEVAGALAEKVGMCLDWHAIGGYGHKDLLSTKESLRQLLYAGEITQDDLDDWPDADKFRPIEWNTFQQISIPRRV